MDEIFLKNAFESTGHPCMRVKRITHRTTGILADYCFVEFAEPAQAEAAAKSLSGKPIPGANGKIFKVNYGNSSRVEVAPGFSVFVGDVSSEVSDGQLLEFFKARYKSVLDAKVQRNPDGSGKGYGFVRFSNQLDLQNAIETMNGIRGCGTKFLVVKPATPKGHMQRGPMWGAHPGMMYPGYPMMGYPGMFAHGPVHPITFSGRDPGKLLKTADVDAQYIDEHNQAINFMEEAKWPLSHTSAAECT